MIDNLSNLLQLIKLNIFSLFRSKIICSIAFFTARLNNLNIEL